MWISTLLIITGLLMIAFAVFAGVRAGRLPEGRRTRLEAVLFGLIGLILIAVAILLDVVLSDFPWPAKLVILFVILIGVLTSKWAKNRREQGGW